MEKIIVESENVVSKNVEKIGALFPNCITETRGEDGKLKKAINFETLQQMLSEDVIEGDESYEFTWVGKKASIAEANRPIQKTLRPCPEESVNWDTTENLYIEGDNLQVLKLLQKSYLGKIKMIYIDPPYNTGHDFVYHDNFTWSTDEWDTKSGRIDDEGNHLFKNTESNGRFHSDWCSMIYSRLLVSHTLLRNDGFIAISIGEEEVHNILEICNEIFGKKNFRNIIAVRRYDKNLNTQFIDEGLSTMNVGLEYVLVYSKNPDTKMNATYRKADGDRAKSGYWKGFWNNADRPTMRYEILGFTPSDGQWKWQKSVAEEAVTNYQEYELNFKDTMTLEEYWEKTGKSKRFIRRNPNGKGKNMGVESWIAPSEYILRSSNWSDILASKSTTVPFSNPKNPELIMELISLFNVEDGDIVMDFFSGSATTSESVFRINASQNNDVQNIHSIMVQIAEDLDVSLKLATDKDVKTSILNSINFLDEINRPHFITELGKERIRRAGKKIKEENPLTTLDLDVGFRVLKLDDWNKKDVEKTPAETSQADLLAFTDNLRDDRSDLDLLFGCLIDSGLELTKPITSEDIEGCAVYSYNEDWLIGCFAENVPNSVIRQIAARKPRKAIFRDSSFADSPAKINVTEVFKMISPDTQLRVI